MDTRTRIEKMLAMAQQDASPAERDNARALLAAEGMWPPPPRPPTAVAAPAPEPYRGTATVSYSGNSVNFVWVRRP